MSVLIQEMYDADYSGVMMTVDPIEGKDSLLGLEINYGACESLVSGLSEGDFYLIKKEDLSFFQKEIGSKRKYIKHQVWDPVVYNQKKDEFNQDFNMRDNFALSDKMILDIVKSGIIIEKFFGNQPQDIEFIIKNKKIVFTQVRPITTQ